MFWGISRMLMIIVFFILFFLHVFVRFCWFWLSCFPIIKKVCHWLLHYFGACLISWKSKKQPTITLSSAEAEYRALRKVVVKVIWLTHLFADLGLLVSSLVLVFCDSQAALHIAKNLAFHERTKHIEIDCHYVWDCPHAQLISLHHIFRWSTSRHHDKAFEWSSSSQPSLQAGSVDTLQLEGVVHIGPNTGPSTTTNIVPEPT